MENPEQKKRKSGRRKRESSPTSKAIAKNLAALMDEQRAEYAKQHPGKQLSLETIAEQIGMTRSAFDGYLCDYTDITAPILYKIADYYGISAAWLIGQAPARSLEPSMQIACQTTGLSEEAVNALIEANRNPREMEVLNALIASPQFWTALGSMAQYIDNTASGYASKKFPPLVIQDEDFSLDLSGFTTQEMEDHGLTPISKVLAAGLYLNDANERTNGILEGLAKERVKAIDKARIRDVTQLEEFPQIEVGSAEWMQLHGDQFNPDGSPKVPPEK